MNTVRYDYDGDFSVISIHHDQESANKKAKELNGENGYCHRVQETEFADEIDEGYETICCRKLDPRNRDGLQIKFKPSPSRCGISGTFILCTQKFIFEAEAHSYYNNMNEDQQLLPFPIQNSWYAPAGPGSLIDNLNNHTAIRPLATSHRNFTIRPPFEVTMDNQCVGSFSRCEAPQHLFETVGTNSNNDIIETTDLHFDRGYNITPPVVSEGISIVNRSVDTAIAPGFMRLDRNFEIDTPVVSTMPIIVSNFVNVPVAPQHVNLEISQDELSEQILEEE